MLAGLAATLHWIEFPHYVNPTAPAATWAPGGAEPERDAAGAPLTPRRWTAP